MKKLDLLNQKFGRLLVIEKSEPIGSRRRAAWLCQCDCGEIKIIKSDALKAGHTKSCGCWNREQAGRNIRKGHAKITKYHPSIASARRVWKKRYSDGNMSFDDFHRLSQINCYYCGEPPSNSQNAATENGSRASQYAKDNGEFIYNGLDRVDSNLPHTVENCVPCCMHCNYAKRDRTLEDFKKWIKQIYNHFSEAEK